MLQRYISQELTDLCSSKSGQIYAPTPRHREHQYSGSGSNLWNTSYYFLTGRLLGSLDGNGTQFYLTFP